MAYGPLSFERFRVPSSEAELTPLERQQLDVIDARVAYHLGEPDRLAPGAPFASAFELWDLVDTTTGTTLATAFGTGMDLYLFAADSTELLGHAFQHCYDGHDDDLTAALASASRPENVGAALPTIEFPVCSTASLPLPTGRLAVDWATLTHMDPTVPKRPPPGGGSWPEVSARGLPSKVRALAHGTVAESGEAELDLRWILTQPPQRITAPAIDLLLSSVAQATAHPGLVMTLVADLLSGAIPESRAAVAEAVGGWRPELEAWATRTDEMGRTAASILDELARAA